MDETPPQLPHTRQVQAFPESRPIAGLRRRRRVVTCHPWLLTDAKGVAMPHAWQGLG